MSTWTFAAETKQDLTAWNLVYFSTDEKRFTVAPLWTHKMIWYMRQWQPRSVSPALAIFYTYSRVPLSASPYGLCCGIETRLYQPYFRWTLPKINRKYYWDVLLMQECCQWSTEFRKTCWSFSKTMQKHIAVITQSSFCAMRHPFTDPDVSLANSPDLNPEDCRILWRCLSEIQVAIQHNTWLLSKPSTFRGNNTTSIRWTSSEFSQSSAPCGDIS